MGSCYKSKVLATAASYIGYHESGTNWTIFSKRLDACGYYEPQKKQNIAWCSQFLDFCTMVSCEPEDRSDEEKKWDAHYFLFQPSKGDLSASVKWQAKYFREHNAWYGSPQVGDWAFFGSSAGNEYHVGIVEKVNGMYIVTIEGNHNDEVARVNRKVSECAGFGRPRYDDEPAPTPDPPKPTEKYEGPWVVFPYCHRNYLQRYDMGPNVVYMQKFLQWLMPNALPKYGADGEIGDETIFWVKRAQKILNVTVDGFYGVKTQAAAKAYRR